MAAQRSTMGQCRYLVHFSVHIGTNHHRHVFSGGKLGLRVFILTILLGLLWSTGPYFYKSHKGCVECHTPHFGTDGICVDCHRGDPRTNRTQIAHYQLIQGKYACFTLPDSPVVKDGHRLINISGCRRCHRIGRKGNALASDLDMSFEKTLPETLAHAIKNPTTFMPIFYFQEANVTSLVNSILDSSTVYASNPSELRQVVHFEKDKEDSDNMFNKHCGSCHRVLTKQWGGLGQGNIGPNLSGLFSKFYFKNYKFGRPWDSNSLRQWLKNPREIRVNAQMPPVNLKQDEFFNLLQIL